MKENGVRERKIDIEQWVGNSRRRKVKRERKKDRYMERER